MDWNFTVDRPIYVQLKERIKLLIVSGAYPPGHKLPSVRDLAIDAAVNPNTLQRALFELERDGLVYAQRTAGRFVTDDGEMIKKAKNELASGRIEAFFEDMAALGYTRDEAARFIVEANREEGASDGDFTD